jgi:hypothetical protein
MRDDGFRNNLSPYRVFADEKTLEMHLGGVLGRPVLASFHSSTISKGD